MILPPPTTIESCVIDKEFVFVITDAELEEKVEGMPLMIARVAPSDFIAY